MRRCTKCVMPDTRPGIVFDDKGVCQACNVAKRRENTNWGERNKELKVLCQQHRSLDRGYDCIIAVSGGKDSHYQGQVMKEEMNMNPMLVSVGNFGWTETGRKNFLNLRERFDCDCISLDLSPATARKMFRAAFIEYGSPTYYWDRAVYTYPIWMAARLSIPLVVYGENINYEYGGKQIEETPFAYEQEDNGVASAIPVAIWRDYDVAPENLQWMKYPPAELIHETKVMPVYLSYYKKWSGYNNMQQAKRHGFRDLKDTGEWLRKGYIEQYDQIDAVGYLVHCWMKWPKFGHSRATDVAAIWVREGRLTRKEALVLVRQHDAILDPKIKDDFCEFVGWNSTKFDQVVNKFYNHKLFNRVDGKWVPKEGHYV